MRKVKAYHFLKDDMCGGYGNEPAWKEGEERSVKGKLVMCVHGYHASPSFYDALNYAKGNMACIVELSGEIIKDTDKYVATKRKLIKVVNAEKILRTWSCDCAERALKKAMVKDGQGWNAIKVARLYNEGKATKEELGAAWDAARDARAAAWGALAAAWDAARAARDVALAAALDAALDVALAGAWDAARAAALAEIKWQKRHLKKLLKPLFEEYNPKS